MTAPKNRVPPGVSSAGRFSGVVPRDAAADESFAAAYCKRNKRALNRSIAKAHDALARGEYFTRDQIMSEIRALRLRRRIDTQ